VSANLDEADAQVRDDGADLVVVGGVEPHLLQLPLLRGWRWRRCRSRGCRRRWRRGRRWRVGLRGRRDLLIRCRCSRGLRRRRRRKRGGVGGGGGRSSHVRVSACAWGNAQPCSRTQNGALCSGLCSEWGALFRTLFFFSKQDLGSVRVFEGVARGLGCAPGSSFLCLASSPPPSARPARAKSPLSAWLPWYAIFSP
jgi:hypothetical protein